MVKNIISVTPDTSLIEAVHVMLDNNLNGLPVVQGGYLVGALSNQDMVVGGTSIHLPTFLKLFKKIDIYKSDAEHVKKEIKKISELKVKDAMNDNPYFVRESDSIFEIIDLFGKNSNASLPVVDEQKILTGIIDRHDVVKFMGEQNIDSRKLQEQLRIEEIINNFLNNFDKKFILVSKARVKIWLVASILFAMVGFAIAWIQILRINI
ncbi:MAG: CBS domain containing membrane protein [Candidatus Yanofskybacteria bacterium GW2011_GWA1_44_21]|nr:MAG: CBS domain containing membrane protein [Candidatus Yanofskybacteria bacterium GW2011_GWA2_44_10]KKT50038.1 MAG: CBS domain containing membrane protein [Candidatus Yanofskybacteria bacterium GW2011_GWA1_44_21]KKT90356.1 MAG: CBS domain containing membrane protein [Candidatus Yanofskybacteria bacterium GW2011_GWB1_45_11]